MDVSHDLPPHLARAKALEAAEKRRRVGGVLRGGGRLGGLGTARRGMTPRQLAAEVCIADPLFVPLSSFVDTFYRRRNGGLAMRKHVEGVI